MIPQEGQIVHWRCKSLGRESSDRASLGRGYGQYGDHDELYVVIQLFQKEGVSVSSLFFITNAPYLLGLNKTWAS
jgi:hypothetical protein